MRLSSCQFVCFALLVAGCMVSFTAHAHGIEMITPYVIWPALALGLVGAAFGGFRRISRVSGLANVLFIFLALLAVGAVAMAIPDIEKSGMIVLLQALFLGLVMGFVVGLVPLIVGYVASEFIAFRFIHKNEVSTGNENDV
jgi:hypothetical protein